MLAFAREVERRIPANATTTWWRKDRELDKAFVDYNQNARDHTVASAYSVRGVKRGTVSTPTDSPSRRLHAGARRAPVSRSSCCRSGQNGTRGEAGRYLRTVTTVCVTITLWPLAADTVTV